MVKNYITIKIDIYNILLDSLSIFNYLWLIMSLHSDTPLWFKENEGIVNCIIEIPMGSMVKYEFNKELNAIEVDRYLTAPMPMPYNYWSLPQTYHVGDKDPLDIILLANYPIIPGAIAKAKVIGVAHMIDGGEADDKIIAVWFKEPLLWNIERLEDLPSYYKNNIEYFLTNYKKLENKVTSIEGFSSREVALDLVKRCQKDYQTL